MLVLTRKAGQSIRIGENIIVKVVQIDGSQVKLGIVAPKGVAIFREELFEKLKETNIDALSSARRIRIDQLFSPKSEEGEKGKNDKD